MYKFLTKNGQLLAFGFGTLITIIFFLMVNSGVEEFTELGKDPARYQTTIFDFGLMAAIGLSILAAIIWLLFGIFHTVTNPKGAIKFLVGIAVIGIIFAIAYNMADGTVTEKWAEKFNITEGISKLVGGAITTTIGLCIAATVIFVLGELRNFFK